MKIDWGISAHQQCSSDIRSKYQTKLTKSGADRANKQQTMDKWSSDSLNLLCLCHSLKIVSPSPLQHKECSPCPVQSRLHQCYFWQKSLTGPYHLPILLFSSSGDFYWSFKYRHWSVTKHVWPLVTVKQATAPHVIGLLGVATAIQKQRK